MMRAAVLMALFWGFFIAVNYQYFPYLLRLLYQRMISVCLELSRRIGRLSEALVPHVIISPPPDDHKLTTSRLDVIFPRRGL